MKILVLGGTRFVGRALVTEALARGHELTLFHRGQTHPGLFPDATEVHGDRTTDLDRLPPGTWDAVVDTCGYTPATVRTSATALQDRAGAYLFVSSVSAYADLSTPPDEDAPLAELGDPSWAEEDDLRSYGARKALCEAEVQEVFGDRALVLRPCIVAGPWDTTDRTTYWVRRAGRAGPILAPGSPDRRVQAVDVRDLAAFGLDRLEAGGAGTFNVAGPEGGVTLDHILRVCATSRGRTPEITWVDDDALSRACEALGHPPPPLWFPAELPGFGAVPVARARAVGLYLRPIEDTLADLADWDRARGEPDLVAGPSAEQEAALLARCREAIR